MNNPFHRPDEQYVRDLDLIGAYRRDTAKYLQLQTGRPLEECQQFVETQIHPDAPLGLRDPRALVLTKNDYGDRKASVATFMKFLNRVVKQNLLLSPSMAVYLPESIRKSTHAEYIAEGVAKRSKVKKEMFVAEQNKDYELVKVKDGEQNNLKINNNSYSGATVSTATILYYKSTHSSLTSTCRAATSYANSANEKFLMGNRHYYSPEITKANIVALVTHADLDAIKVACETHGLRYPSVEDTMQCIQYSTVNYWRSDDHLEIIRRMVVNMSPMERAAVVYSNDMYHIHKLNPEFVVSMLKDLARTGGIDDTTPDSEFDTYDEDLQLLANFLCFDTTKGRSKQQMLDEEPAAYYRIKNTARLTLETLQKYAPLIQAFLMTESMPSSIHAFPSIYRKAVVVSDTDSTMFTLQYWVEQCMGRIGFDIESKRIVFVMVFFVSQLVQHLLAKLSANMGVDLSKLRLLAMKNEYYFAVMSLTTRSKHYYASQDAREGIMFEKAKMEIKGVGLRDSKVPKVINDGAKAMMEEIINTVKAEQQLDIRDILKRVGDIERSIIASIEAGKAEYMTSGQIKSKESYKNADNATYAQYELWQSVFAPYFGATKEPPYSVVKVSLVANNKTEIDAWCSKMSNPEMAAKLKQWLFDKRRSDLSTLFIPSTVVETMGIPKDIVKAIDTRKIISNTMGVYYIMLESLGIFMQDKNITRLISDYY